MLSPQTLWTESSLPVDDPPIDVEIGYASHTSSAAMGRSVTFCTHRPQHCAVRVRSCRAATSQSLHIVNRDCDDDEEYLLLFFFIRSRDEVHV
jgi:hypothetical protein